MIELRKYRDVIGFDFRNRDEVIEYDSGAKFPVLRNLFGSSRIPPTGLLSGLYCRLESLNETIQAHGYENGLKVAIATDNFPKFAKEVLDERKIDMTRAEFAEHIKCDPIKIDDNWRLVGLDIVDGWLNPIGWHLIPDLASKLGIPEFHWGLLPTEQIAQKAFEIADRIYENRAPLFICAIYEVFE